MVELNRKGIFFTDLDSWIGFKGELTGFLYNELVYEDFLSFDSHVVEKNKYPGYTKETVHINCLKNFAFPCDLYYPPLEKMPVVLICPGFGQARDESDIVFLAKSLCDSGMGCIIPGYDSVGDRADMDNVLINTQMVTDCLNLLGFSNLGLRVTTNLACIKYLKSRNNFDGDRIGITGLCQGAIVSWFTSPLCQDIKSSAPLCGATDYYAICMEYCSTLGGWSGLSPYMNGLLKYGDIPQVISLMAPKPLFVQNNILDRHWPYSGFARCRNFAKNIYGLYDSEKNVRFVVENEPHAYAGRFVTNICTWFLNTL